MCALVWDDDDDTIVLQHLKTDTAVIQSRKNCACESHMNAKLKLNDLQCTVKQTTNHAHFLF